MAKNSVCHYEWSSTNLDKTKKFLHGLFGWDMKQYDKNYLMFQPPDGPGGGIMKVEKVVPGKSPYIYIEVDNIEPYIEKAKKLGGGVDTPKREIPGMGWFAHIMDHDKNIYGLFEPMKRE